MEKKKEKKRKFTYSKNGIMTSEYSVFVLLWCFFKTKIWFFNDTMIVSKMSLESGMPRAAVSSF